jgi:hypothetical protein
MSRQRIRWQAARRYVTPTAAGGLLLPGDTPPVLRAAPLPAGTTVQLWEDCGCDYQPPGTRALDPAWTGWTEDPPRTATSKQSLRLALTRKPRNGDPGGLLGPNFYALGHFHSGDATREQPGFPDLLIWSPNGREVWELKAMGAVPTWPQAVHMTALEAAGFVVRLVRPCCLLSGAVDRWLAALAGVDPTRSPWAPRPRTELDTARARRASPPPAGDGPVVVPYMTPAARRARLQLVVPPPPGRAVTDDDRAIAAAVGWLVPMPAGGNQRQVTGVEEWLRQHDFTPAGVPWPMRIATAAGLLVVWANSAEPAAGPGQPRPRTWRVVPLQTDPPENLLRSLGADMICAPSLRALLELMQGARPATPVFS